MNSDLIKKALEISQRCRRNWDLSKTIPNEHLDIFISSVINSPSKQNEEYYSAMFITRRNIIEQIYQHTNFNTGLDINDLSKNPQVLANLLVAFCKRVPDTYRNDLEEYESETTMEENRNVAIGIASGQLSMTAALLGYSTGFCKCFDTRAVGILLNDSPLLLLGIGFPDENRDRTEHHNSKIKFNTFNKPITINKITPFENSKQTITGAVANKGYTVELKFKAPQGNVLVGRGKAWMKQMGASDDDIQNVMLDIQVASRKLEIDTGYPYVDFSENSLRYVWTSNNLDNLQSLKKYILALPTIQEFINRITAQGWIIE